MPPPLLISFLTVSLVVLSGCTTPPERAPAVRLTTGASDTVVVNSRYPTALTTRALDVAGHAIAGAPIRYTRAGGDSLPVTPTGLVTCIKSGDVSVRAVLEGLSSLFVVQCRLVEYVRLPGPLQFVLGDTTLSRPFSLPLAAYGIDGRPIEPYVARVQVKDSGIATLHGLIVYPRSRGITGVGAHIGDRDAYIGLHIYQRVASLASIDTLLRVPDTQRLFAAPLRLNSGEFLRQRLPPGQWMLTMMPETDTAPDRIHLRIEGGHCQDHLFDSPRRWGCTAGPGATVVLYRPFGHAKVREATEYLLVRWLFS